MTTIKVNPKDKAVQNKKSTTPDISELLVKLNTDEISLKRRKKLVELCARHLNKIDRVFKKFEKELKDFSKVKKQKPKIRKQIKTTS
ncbi:MAG: hypothetical protein ACOYMF_03605 [Bacteroidales bacterium]